MSTRSLQLRRDWRVAYRYARILTTFDDSLASLPWWLPHQIIRDALTCCRAREAARKKESSDA